MSNFYGKRFLSSLVGALTVLGSPVVSAGKNGSGRGDLGEGVHSASRDKNNGSLGKLKSSREVKNIDGLKKVLEETGGEVVRVSPDGEGGFVAFVKTPTGKVVTVAIVGVSLIAVIAFLVVLYIQKSNGGSEGNVDDDGNVPQVSNMIENVDIKDGAVNNLNIDSNDNRKFKVEDAKGDLLTNLFKGSRERYGLFVGELLRDFFDYGHTEKMFEGCDRSLDKFLESVFSTSDFKDGDDTWVIKFKDGNLDVHLCRSIGLSEDMISVGCNDESAGFLEFCEVVMGYLSEKKLVRVPRDGKEASWGEKISVVLFAVWCLVEFGCEFKDYDKLKECLGKKGIKNLEGIFEIIRNYVKDRLKAAGKGCDGQKLKQVS